MRGKPYEHIPVMADECLSFLSIKQNGVYIDGTIGGAGHALKILDRLGGEGAALIGIDRDETAAAVSSTRLAARNETLGCRIRCEVVCDNFSNIDIICNKLGIAAADGILLDLGVSSHQLDEAERGFSFKNEAPLDMRMDRSSKLTAADIVNGYAERELAGIILKYGEERWAVRIAQFIVKNRAIKPILTTRELAGIILSAIPKDARGKERHPARRTFQAIRIAVNDELGAIEEAIKKAAGLLNVGGRLVVISFHSLEDRIVKNTIGELTTDCVCPKDFPVCVCGRTAILKKLTRKPALPGGDELLLNPRARSAKLRAAEKIAVDGKR